MDLLRAMEPVQQQFLWPDDPLLDRRPAELPTTSSVDSTLESLRPPADDLSRKNEARAQPTSHVPSGPPLARPLRQAVEAGVFGLTEAGPVDPDDDDVAAITAEHVQEMTMLLLDLDEVRETLRQGHDPRTGRVPKTSEKRQQLTEHLQKEDRRLAEAYANTVDVYANAFDDEMAEALDEWVRMSVSATGYYGGYEPSHPWHYYPAGDHAAPIPVEEIPAATDAGQWLERKLPKNRAKRLVRVREMLEAEAQELEQSERRYQDVVQRGAEALNRYDREIAYGGNDELVRASTIALKFNHIRGGRGRIQWLEAELKRLAGGGETDGSK